MSARPGSPAAWLAILLGLLLTGFAAGAQVPARTPDRVLTGTLTGADHQSYKSVPFDVPDGVAQLVVGFDYDMRDRKTVIDLGVHDPHRFRGASGGNKPGFVISADAATPSYLPGPIDAGLWKLALAVPNIRQGTTAHWEARIWYLRAHETLPISASVADRGPGWYRGDLHLHSGHSDGSCASQSGARVPCPLFLTLQAAASRKLDFVAVTEHNTTSHHAALREAQPHFDRMLLIPGREITTFFGHFNIFGVVEPIDFRIQRSGTPRFDQLADRVHALGGILSINHPAAPSGEACMGCGWTMPNADLRKVDAIEIVNGGSVAAEAGNAEGRLSGLPFWLKALRGGMKPTAVGGSDNHDATRAALEPGAVGRPTTVVYAESFSERGILSGIRSGRVFIDLTGAGDTLLDLRLAAGKAAAAMGAQLEATAGTSLFADVQLAGVQTGTLELLRGTELVATRSINGETSLQVPVRLARGRHHVRAQVRDQGGRLLLIGNSVLAVIR